MFLRRITLQNLLSFGPGDDGLEPGPLNVLIGPNGSSKSNLIAVISLLRAAPRDLAAPIHKTGGIGEWLHKGESRIRKGSVDAVVDYMPGEPLRYHLGIARRGGRILVGEEFIEDGAGEDDRGQAHRYFGYLRGRAVARSKDGTTRRIHEQNSIPASRYCRSGKTLTVSPR